MDLLAKAAETSTAGEDSESSPRKSTGDRPKRSEPTPFILKLYELVSDPSTDDLCTWTENGDSFVVLEPGRFTSEILPRYFKHHNFSSFVRQLNQYAFNKCSCVRLEYRNPNFLRGRFDLLAQIERRPNRKPTPPSLPTVSPDTGPPTTAGSGAIKAQLPSPSAAPSNQEAASSWPGPGFAAWRPPQANWQPSQGKSPDIFNPQAGASWPAAVYGPGGYVGSSLGPVPARPDVFPGRDSNYEAFRLRRHFSPELASRISQWSRSEDALASGRMESHRETAESPAWGACGARDTRQAEQATASTASQSTQSLRVARYPASTLVSVLRERLLAVGSEYVHVDTALNLVAELEAQQERELLSICTETIHAVDRFRSCLWTLCARRASRAYESAVGEPFTFAGRSTSTSNPTSGQTDSPMEQAQSSTTTDAPAGSSSVLGSMDMGPQPDVPLPGK